MDARAINARLRMGETLAPEDLAWFARGLASGEVTDAQAGAFAMAVCLRGLGEAGRVALTRAMRDSGKVLHWDLPGPVLPGAVWAIPAARWTSWNRSPASAPP